MKEEIKEYIFQAHQSGKSETSALVRSIMDKIKEAVKYEVETTINGNLRDIKTHMHKLDEKLDEMNKKIDELKKETEPIIESKHTIEGVRKFLIWVAAPAAIFWAAMKALANFMK